MPSPVRRLKLDRQTPTDIPPRLGGSRLHAYERVDSTGLLKLSQIFTLTQSQRFAF